VENHTVLRRRGSHVFWTNGSEMAVGRSALSALLIRTNSGIHFSQRLRQPHGYSADGWIRWIAKTTDDIIGNRNRDLPDCIIESLLLSFWTLSIVPISTNRQHNVSETGSVSVFRRGGGDTYSTEKQKLAFPQAMPEQKKVNHWKQGDYKHLTAGRVHGM
jgi:hypothetical protein